MKIGITERGDASIDLSWADKLESDPEIKGAILITKNITPAFIDKAIKYKDKVIVHVTCTGYGGTVLEPNIPTWQKQLDNLDELLLNGFDPRQVVIRIDPIIPTEKGLVIPQKIIYQTCHFIERYRISVIDMYKHVLERFVATGIPSPYNGSFYPSKKQLELVDDWLFDNQENGHFEGCAEPNLKFCEPRGCVSDKDLEILGIKNDKPDTSRSQQRKHCLCCSYKYELLENKKDVPINAYIVTGKINMSKKIKYLRIYQEILDKPCTFVLYYV